MNHERVFSSSFGSVICAGCHLEIYRHTEAEPWKHVVGEVPRCKEAKPRPDTVILVKAGDIWTKNGKKRVIHQVTDRYYADRGSTAYDGFQSNIHWAGPGKLPTQNTSPFRWDEWAKDATLEFRRGGQQSDSSETTAEPAQAAPPSAGVPTASQVPHA